LLHGCELEEATKALNRSGGRLRGALNLINDAAWREGLPPEVSSTRKSWNGSEHKQPKPSPALGAAHPSAIPGIRLGYPHAVFSGAASFAWFSYGRICR
jgi:hypothetical protein